MGYLEEAFYKLNSIAHIMVVLQTIAFICLMIYKIIVWFEYSDDEDEVKTYNYINLNLNKYIKINLIILFISLFLYVFVPGGVNV